MEKVFDSSANCIECSPVVDFAKNNVNAILSNFDSSYHFWLHPRVVNGKTVVSFASHIGPAYFMGIYCDKEMNYIFFEKRKNINYVFGRGAYYYWMYFNLLKNQWALYPW
ncbi:MAG: hypothetical protein H7257_00220 [Taibaiella sp.]|nr:hypothetical protein [Taibaiella sp.]